MKKSNNKKEKGTNRNTITKNTTQTKNQRKVYAIRYRTFAQLVQEIGGNNKHTNIFENIYALYKVIGEGKYTTKDGETFVKFHGISIPTFYISIYMKNLKKSKVVIYKAIYYELVAELKNLKKVARYKENIDKVFGVSEKTKAKETVNAILKKLDETEKWVMNKEKNETKVDLSDPAIEDLI